MLHRILILLVFAATTTWAATACAVLNIAQANKPVVVIVSPPSGTQYSEGDDVAVQSTATDSRGIARVELLVDGTSVAVDNAPNAQGQASFTVLQKWKATMGTHTVTVRATNTAGAVSDTVAILVSVSAAAPPTAAATVAPVPSATATTSPSATATNVPAKASTPIPVTLAPNCPGPPVIVSFSASPTTISSGDSTTLNWGSVKNATSAAIDHGIGGIGTPGNRKVNPTTTTTYTLTATGCGGVTTSQVTVTVNPGAPKTTEVSGKATLNAGADGSADAECPGGSIVTGGGFEFPSGTSVLVYNSIKSGNKWHVSAKNSSAVKITLTAYATCLSNTSGSTAQVNKPMSVPANSFMVEYVDCPGGTVITGGGFAFIQSGGKAYYQFSTSSSTSTDSWEIYGNNTTGAAQTLNGYAICLTLAGASSQHTQSQISVGSNASNSVTADCPAGTLVTGGGFYYARDVGTTLFASHKNGNGWEVSMNNATASPQDLLAYPVCTSFKP